MPNFNHLHCHTQFSLLDGAASISGMMKKAKADGMTAVALTDHGNMFGAFKFVAEADKAGIKPIVGCEFYLVEDRHQKKFDKGKKDERYHQLLLAKNMTGYHNLAKLCSLGFIEGFYSKFPRIDKELLLKYHEGLIATSCCIGATVPQTILHEGEEAADKELKWWVDLFGREDYYIELQRHGLENIDGTGLSQEDVNQVLLRLAKKHDLKVICTNDSHYLDQKDSEAHDILLCINTGSKKSDPTNKGEMQVEGKDETGKKTKYRFAFPNNEFFFKTQDQMNKIFADVPQALDFTCEIADKVEKIKLKRDILMPNFPLPPQFPEQFDFLKHLTFEGAKRHYGSITADIEERLNFELETIKKMGFSGYFLIVQDFINSARDLGVWVGPGRGCLSPNTKIVLKNGQTKPISEIKIGDEVWTLEGKTEKVQTVFEYETTEDLLCIKTYYGDYEGVSLTADHKVLAEKLVRPKNYENWSLSTQKARKTPEPKGELTWIEAKDLAVGDWVFVPKPSVPIKETTFFDLAQFANGHDLKADQDFVYHHVLNVLCGVYQQTKKTKRYLPLNENWFIILGMFVGDGWIRKSERPDVSFAFGNNEKDLKHLEFVKSVIEEMGFDYSVGKLHRGSIQLHIRNKFLYLFFKNLFSEYEFTAQSKYIPDLVLQASEKNIAAFLKGYHWADGHQDTHKFRYTTVSRRLADQLRFLHWRLGLPAALGIDDRKDTRKEFENTQAAFSVSIPKDDRIGTKQAEKQYFFRKIEKGIVRKSEILETICLDPFVEPEPEILEINGGFLLKIREITVEKGIKKVYDLSVTNQPNYLTSSFVVHNSAAGSAVAYCVGITNIDPIKYELLFERFLNPERVSMPDIDVDFDDEGRQKVIDYVVDKYGRSQVAQIATYGTMAAKMSIKDVARVMDLPLDQANYLAKLVPEKPGTKLSDAFQEIPELAQIIKSNDERAKILEYAHTLEGSVRGTGIHAAGVIIAPDDIKNYVPVFTSKDSDLYITQFEGKVIEDAGMLKMDFLGLKTLTIMRDAIHLIKKNHKIEIDIDKIPLDDKKTYELYQRGDTIGTFQFESVGMQKYLKELKPTNIEDLIAMNALYRPGPLQFIPVYIDRKHGREPVEYPHALLEPVLKNTYGIMVYQEQIMLTARILGGYSLGGADLLRRAMGKKDKEKMAKEKDKFVEGANKLHNIPESKAADIFATMERFAEYGFNRSHSAAYSVLAYQTAYLKAHYPAEYMSAVMTHSMGDIEKISFFLEETKRMGVTVLGPDVNESSRDFDVNKKGQIRFGLGAIKGTGEAAVEALIEERNANGNFTSVWNLAERVNLRTVNKKTFESLAYAGGFDSFEEFHRAQYFHLDPITGIEKILKYGASKQADKGNENNILFGGAANANLNVPKLPDCEVWSEMEKLKHEKEVVGFYLSGHPLKQYETEIRGFCTCSLAEVQNMRPPREIRIAGILSSVQIKQSKNGNQFASFNIEDYESTLNLALFGEDFLKFRHLLVQDQFLYIKGKMQERYNQPNQFELRINSIELLSEVMERYGKEVEIRIKAEQLTSSLITDLQKILDKNKGNCKLRIPIMVEGREVKTVSRNWKVRPSKELMAAVKGLDLEMRVG